MRLEPRGIALGAAIACGACFSPNVSDGQYSCGNGELCPPGFACDPTGACVRDATELIDAAPVADAPTDAAGIDAAAFDAGAPQSARVYLIETGDDEWVAADAAVFFDGADAPDPAQIGAAFSHCTFGEEVLCVSTASRWHCTDDGADSWFSRAWSSSAPSLDGAAPTFLDLWVFPDSPGGTHEAWISAGTLWWIFQYNAAPTEFLMGFWSLSLAVDYTDVGTYDALWSVDPNAPPDPTRIVADRVADSEDLAWLVWDDGGVEYAYDVATDLWSAPRSAPLLALPGAPPASLVVGVTRCDDTTYAFTRAGVP